MYNKVKNELIERYLQTGKVGFTKPASKAEAFEIIETLSQVFQTEEAEQVKQEETVINLSDVTERLRNFFKNFN